MFRIQDTLTKRRTVGGTANQSCKTTFSHFDNMIKASSRTPIPSMNQPASPLCVQPLRRCCLIRPVYACIFLLVAWNMFKIDGKISGARGDIQVNDWQRKNQSNMTSFYSAELSLSNHSVVATANGTGFADDNSSLSSEQTQIKAGQDDLTNGTNPTSIVELYHELKALAGEDLLKKLNQLSREEMDEVALYHELEALSGEDLLKRLDQLSREEMDVVAKYIEQIYGKPKPRPKRYLVDYLDKDSVSPTPNDIMYETTRNMLKQLSREELFNRFNQSFTGEFEQARYCEHSTNNANTTKDGNCYKLLAPRVVGKRAWFFFGDSQMAKLISLFVYPYNITSTQKAADCRCGLLDYCYFEKAKRWKPPFSPNQTQGPAEFGKENPFCVDLSTCINARWESATPNGTHFIENLVVEFASDVEQQSIYTNTTQEAATIHVANQLQLRNLTNDDSVCVANAGLHDQILCSGKSTEYCLEIYLNNVNSYLKLLQYVCGNIIWISTTSVRGDYKLPQRNDSIFLWNQRVNATIAKNYPNVFFLDVWNVSLHSPRVDATHFHDEYYSPLRKLFTSMM